LSVVLLRKETENVVLVTHASPPTNVCASSRPSLDTSIILFPNGLRLLNHNGAHACVVPTQLLACHVGSP
jgi:hypothetical protein